MLSQSGQALGNNIPKHLHGEAEQEIVKRNHWHHNTLWKSVPTTHVEWFCALIPYAQLWLIILHQSLQP